MSDNNEDLSFELDEDLTPVLDAMGQFGAKLGHDFNNILGSIQGCVDLIKAKVERQFPEGNPYEKQFKLIEASLKKGTLITSKIRGYVRPGDSDRQSVDASILFAAVSKLIKVSGVLDTDIEVVVETDNLIHANELQVSQLLIGLCSNAIDAMSKRSDRTLLLVAMNQNIGENDLELEAGSYVRLSVADHGGGLMAQVRDRLFEPFMSTKRSKVGDGFGLSLPMGREIMRRHNGALQVRSESDIGTVVHLYFPCLQK